MSSEKVKRILEEAGIDILGVSESCKTEEIETEVLTPKEKDFKDRMKEESVDALLESAKSTYRVREGEPEGPPEVPGEEKPAEIHDVAPEGVPTKKEEVGELPEEEPTEELGEEEGEVPEEKPEEVEAAPEAAVTEEEGKDSKLITSVSEYTSFNEETGVELDRVFRSANEKNDELSSRVLDDLRDYYGSIAQPDYKELKLNGDEKTDSFKAFMASLASIKRGMENQNKKMEGLQQERESVDVKVDELEKDAMLRRKTSELEEPGSREEKTSIALADKSRALIKESEELRGQVDELYAEVKAKYETITERMQLSERGSYTTSTSDEHSVIVGVVEKASGSPLTYGKKYAGHLDTRVDAVLEEAMKEANEISGILYAEIDEVNSIARLYESIVVHAKVRDTRIDEQVAEIKGMADSITQELTARAEKVDRVAEALGEYRGVVSSAKAIQGE